MEVVYDDGNQIIASLLSSAVSENDDKMLRRIIKSLSRNILLDIVTRLTTSSTSTDEGVFYILSVICYICPSSIAISVAKPFLIKNSCNLRSSSNSVLSAKACYYLLKSSISTSEFIAACNWECLQGCSDNDETTWYTLEALKILNGNNSLSTEQQQIQNHYYYSSKEYALDNIDVNNLHSNEEDERNYNFHSSLVNIHDRVYLPKLSDAEDNPKTKSFEPLIQTPSTVENIVTVASALAYNDNRPILLQGSCNSQKTSVIKSLANSLEISNVVEMHFDDQMDAKSLLGTLVCSSTPGQFTYQKGTLVSAMEAGHWVIIDNIDKNTPADIIALLAPVLTTRTIKTEDKVVVAHPAFQIFATMNSCNTSSSSFHLWHKVPMIDLLSGSLTNQKNEEISVTNQSKDVEVLVESYIGTSNNAAVVNLVLNTWRNLGQYKKYTLRDLKKWVIRVASSSRPYLDSSSTTTSYITEELKNLIFADALDIFAAGIIKQDARKGIIESIKSSLGLVQVNDDIHNVPEYNDTSHESLIIGRVCLNRFSSTTSTTSTISHIPSTLRVLEKLAACVKHSEPCVLIGETGTGKTTVIQSLASALHATLVVVNLNIQSDSNDLLGGYKPVDVKSSIATPLYQSFVKLFQETWDAESNASFLLAIFKAFEASDWIKFVKGMEKAIRMANGNTSTSSSSPKKKQKTEKWQEFSNLVSAFKANVNSSSSASFAFSFVEGVLVQAIRNGWWILLDEINLASSETLERLSGLLDSTTSSVLVTERGDVRNIERHESFRIFGAMNPPDVGKKDLPPTVERRFTRVYVDEITNENELQGIVRPYFIESQEDFSSLLIQFYLRARKDGTNCVIVDGAGACPKFSLRTLSRVLKTMKRFVSSSFYRYGVRKALYESLVMHFCTTLDRPSFTLMERRVCAMLKFTSRKSEVPPRPGNRRSTEDVLLVAKSVWCKVGPLKSFDDALPNATTGETKFVLTRSVQTYLTHVARAVSVGTYPVLLQGPTSAGKTSLVTYLGKLLGHKVVRINNHEQTDLQEYLGSYQTNLSSGKLEFQEGILVTALRNGWWVILDELNLAPSEVLEALNRLLDDNHEIFIPETQEVVTPHPAFMLFATQNPPGVLYGGRKVLSQAFQNRFVQVQVDEVSPSEMKLILEKRIICGNKGLPPSFCQMMVNVLVTLTRDRTTSTSIFKTSSVITTRDLLRWGSRLPESKEELATVGYYLLAERLRTSFDRNNVRRVLEKCIGVKIKDGLYNSPTALSRALGNYKKIAQTSSLSRLFTLVNECVRHSEPVLLVGPTGCSKTTICQIVAAFYNREISIVNCHQHTETQDLLGGLRPVRNRERIATEIKDLLSRYYDITSTKDTSLASLIEIGNKALASSIRGSEEESSIIRGSEEESPIRGLEETDGEVQLRNALSRGTALFSWQDGPLLTSMKSGAFFVLDEINLAQDAVLERLNSVLEPSRSITLAEGGSVDSNHVTTAHEEWRVLATMNPGGDFGKRELSPALRNRFTEIWVDPVINDALDDTFEDLRLILSAYVKASSCASTDFTKIISAMIDFLKYQRRCIPRAPLTLRDMIAWMDFILLHSSSSTSSLFEMYVHGAQMIYVDGLPLIVPSEAVSQNATRYLYSQFDLSDDDSDSSSLIISDTQTTFGIGGFVTTKCNTHSVTNFSLDAPTSKRNMFRILRALTLAKPILLEGSPGVGKSSVVTALASKCRRHLIRINLSEQTDLADLFGSDMPSSSSSFAWNDGGFLTALTSGYWVLLDELNLASQTVLEGLNSVLDHRGSVYIPEIDQSFEKHPDFRVFAAQNPIAQGGGRHGLPASFINRFTRVYMSELSPTDLRCIVQSPKYEKLIEFNTEMQNLTNAFVIGRTGGPWEFNLRDVFRMKALVEDSQMSFSSAKDLVYSSRMRTLSDRIAIDKVFSSFFPESASTSSSKEYRITRDTLTIGTATVKRKKNTRSNKSLLWLNSLLPAMEGILHCVSHNWPCLVVGKAGVGKTLAIRTLASLLNIPNLIELSMAASGNESSDVAADLIGCFSQVRTTSTTKTRAIEAIDNAILTSETNDSTRRRRLEAVKKRLGFSTTTEVEVLELLDTISDDIGEELDNSSSKQLFEWVDGPLVRAMIQGSWIILEDANHCSGAILDRLNAVLEPNGKLLISECGSESDGSSRVITPHPDFRIFLTMKEDSHSSCEMSRAMRNRCMEICILENDRTLFQDKLRILNSAVKSTMPFSQLLSLVKETTQCNNSDIISEKRLLYNLGSEIYATGNISESFEKVYGTKGFITDSNDNSLYHPMLSPVFNVSSLLEEDSVGMTNAIGSVLEMILLLVSSSSDNHQCLLQQSLSTFTSDNDTMLLKKLDVRNTLPAAIASFVSKVSSGKKVSNWFNSKFSTTNNSLAVVSGFLNQEIKGNIRLQYDRYAESCMLNNKTTSSDHNLMQLSFHQKTSSVKGELPQPLVQFLYPFVKAIDEWNNSNNDNELLLRRFEFVSALTNDDISLQEFIVRYNMLVKRILQLGGDDNDIVLSFISRMDSILGKTSTSSNNRLWKDGGHPVVPQTLRHWKVVDETLACLDSTNISDTNTSDLVHFAKTSSSSTTTSSFNDKMEVIKAATTIIHVDSADIEQKELLVDLVRKNIVMNSNSTDSDSNVLVICTEDDEDMINEKIVFTGTSTCDVVKNFVSQYYLKGLRQSLCASLELDAIESIVCQNRNSTSAIQEFINTTTTDNVKKVLPYQDILWQLQSSKSSSNHHHLCTILLSQTNLPSLDCDKVLEAVLQLMKSSIPLIQLPTITSEVIPFLKNCLFNSSSTANNTLQQLDGICKELYDRTLPHIAPEDRIEEEYENVGIFMIELGLLRWKYYVLSLQRIDPGVVPLIKAGIYKDRVLDCDITALIESAMDTLLGITTSTSNSTEKYKSKIEKLEKRAISRPVNLYENLYEEVMTFHERIIHPRGVNVDQCTIDSFMTKMMRQYDSYYADVLHPLLSSLKLVSHGITITNTNSTGNQVVVQSLVTFPKRAYVADLDCNSSIPLLLASLFELRGRGGVALSSSKKVFDKVSEVWSQHQVALEEAEKKASAMYITSTNVEVESEESIYEAEFNEMFNSTSTNKTNAQPFPDELYVEAAKTHFSINLNEDHMDRTEMWIRSVKTAASSVISADSLGFPSCSGSLSIALDHFLKSSSSSSSSFHLDGNVEETSKIIPIMDELITIGLLPLLAQWPENALLQKLVVAADNLRNTTTSSSSIATLMASVTALMAQLQQWEDGASKAVSLSLFISKLSSVVTSWRKLELEWYKTSLTSVEEKQQTSAYKSFFYLYTLLTSSNTSLKKELFKSLDGYIRSSTVGQFKTRLKLIKSFGKQSIMCCNLYRFYSRLFADRIEVELQNGRERIEKRVKELVSISKWDEQSYYALKESSEKSHRALFKLVKEYEVEVLSAPVQCIIDSCNNDDNPTTISSSNTITKEFITPLSSFSNVIVKPLDTDNTYARRWPSLSSQVSKKLSAIIQKEEDLLVEDLCTGILSRVSTLSQDGTRIASKKKALIDLFTILKEELKLSTFVNHIPSSYKDNFEIFSKKRGVSILDNMSEDYHKSDMYFLKLLCNVPIIRYVLCNGYHADITAVEASRIGGYVENAMYRVLTCREKLLALAENYSDLRQWIDTLSKVSSSTSNSSITVWGSEDLLRKVYDSQKESLEKLLEMVKDLELITVVKGIKTRVESAIVALEECNVHNIFGINVRSVLSQNIEILNTIQQNLVDSSSDNSVTRNAFNNTASYIASLEFIIPEEQEKVLSTSTTYEEILEFILCRVQDAVKDPLDSDLKIPTLVSMLSSFTQSNNTKTTLFNRKTMFLNLLPALGNIANVLHNRVNSATRELKSFSKLSYILTQIFKNLLRNGFCKTNEDEGDEEEGDNFQDDVDGTGMGAGDGKKDVSEEITDEEQLLGLKSDIDESKNSGENQEENGVEMENDFEGSMEDLPDEKKKEGDEDEEEEEELDREMANDDMEMDDVVDEKMWDKEDEEDNKPTEDEKFESGAEAAAGEEAIEDEIRTKEEEEENSSKKNESKSEDGNDNDDDNDDNDNDQQQQQLINDDEEELYEEDHGIDREGGNEHQEEEGEEKEDFELPDDMNMDDFDQEDPEEEEEDEEDPSDDTDQPTVDQAVPEEEENDENDENDEMDSTDVTMDDGTSNNIDFEEQEEEEEKDTKENKEDNENDNVPAFGDTEQEPNCTSIVEENGSGENNEEGEKDEKENDDSNENNTGGGAGAANSSNEHSSSAQNNSSESFDDAAMNEAIDPNPYRNPGDAAKHWEKRLNVVNSNETTTGGDDSNEEENAGANQDVMFEEDDGNDNNSMQALAPIDTDDTDDTKDNIPNVDESMFEEKVSNEKDEKSSSVEKKPTTSTNSEVQHQSEKSTEENEEDVKEEVMEIKEEKFQEETQEEKAETKNQEINSHLTNQKFEITTTEEEEEEVEEIEERLLSEEEILELRKNISSPSGSSSSEELWASYDNLTRDLSTRLCEQLRLILAPTTASKLCGDYKTGKRINMRKVISYIASDFRRDKIWLRRTKKAKRAYQVVVAIDDSESMTDNNAGSMALEAMTVLCKAMGRLEVGDVSVVSFGSDIKTLHPLGMPFTDEAGASVVSAFKFDQQATEMNTTMDALSRLLLAEKNGSTLDVTQVVFMISDARFDADGRKRMKKLMTQATERGQLFVLIVLDSTSNSSNSNSILDTKTVSFENGAVVMEPYLDNFPFPYYVILQSIERLPETLSDALRQWFEMLNSAS